MPTALSPFAPRASGALAVCAALLLSAGCGAAPERTAEQPPGAAEERDLRFTSGPDTLHGTFAVPKGASGKVPGALIVSGSGPTDRDGNSDMRPNADTNRNFARVLADAGVASLRYDKLGSGDTGMASHAKDDRIGYDVFEQEMTDAYAELAAQPGVDPGRLMVLGHSEGSLFALRAPQVIEENPPKALVLAAPVGNRYLDTVDRQITEQVRGGESQGRFDAERATAVLSDTRLAIARVRGGHPVPDDIAPELDALFRPELGPFLRRIDGLDPARLGADLPADVATLVLWGEADSQVVRQDVDRLMTGLDGAERVDLPDTDHVFRVYHDSPGSPVLDDERDFSPDVAPALTGFVDSALAGA
ncbi:hypothetical protein CLV63_101192 [Murinocardiopsis flavida]|uniref:Uncharacterized protein n=1 Tax=Murinocardiopsis flavida TaxID=645275 RepID=A0A2P8DU23_9ACTN|nr:alpha/beta fold hydrolase [Murinocardiopsis flavida]PSL00718.1 hypothetical protein CLV63_101192 [Murinocardiopsis flavida]